MPLIFERLQSEGRERVRVGSAERRIGIEDYPVNLCQIALNCAEKFPRGLIILKGLGKAARVQRPSGTSEGLHLVNPVNAVETACFRRVQIALNCG
jgi:hypothetical protein